MPDSQSQRLLASNEELSPNVKEVDGDEVLVSTT